MGMSESDDDSGDEMDIELLAPPTSMSTGRCSRHSISAEVFTLDRNFDAPHHPKSEFERA